MRDSSLVIPIREYPPDRYKSFQQKVKIGGSTVHVSFGLYDDGTLAHLFIDVHKTGSALRSLFSALGQFLSVGLQHRIPLRLYVELLENIDFEPNGSVTGSPTITEAKSILDYIARELRDLLLSKSPLLTSGRFVPKENIPTPESSTSVKVVSPKFTGEVCITCGGCRLRRSGACLVCEDCGSNSGCG